MAWQLVLWHCTNLENAEMRHQFCPRTINSWCKYQSNKITGMSTYKPSCGIPPAIKTELEKTFRDLSADDLLTQCLEVTTQNPNEAFNQIIWQKCPKKTFVSREVLECGVFSAILNYNDGFTSLASVLEKLHISPGPFFKVGALAKDVQRVQNMEQKGTNKVKDKRNKLRAIKRGFIDKEKEHEGGESYCSGTF